MFSRLFAVRRLSSEPLNKGIWFGKNRYHEHFVSGRDVSEWQQWYVCIRLCGGKCFHEGREDHPELYRRGQQDGVAEELMRIAIGRRARALDSKNCMSLNSGNEYARQDFRAYHCDGRIYILGY